MWKYNETDNLPGDSIYHSADELYHYGVLGMKWRHHKARYDYGSLGANISGRIRNGQLRNAKNRIRSDGKDLRSMTKNYEWMKKNHAEIKKSGSIIGNSRLLTSIRQHRMNKLKRKIGITKDSIKEDHQIVKELNKYESNARKKAQNKAAAKKILTEAKARYKSANKQYSKDFNKSSTLLGAWGPGNKERHKQAYNSLVAANKAKKAYKKAKANYKKYR